MVTCYITQDKNRKKSRIDTETHGVGVLFKMGKLLNSGIGIIKYRLSMSKNLLK